MKDSFIPLDRVAPFVPFGAIVFVATLLFWPALFLDGTVVHNDSMGFSIPLFEILGRAVRGDEGILWSDLVSGGHPLFAEGQGGFAHPVNFIVAVLPDSIFGYGILHYVYTILGAVGLYLLCRELGLGRLASLFAAFSLVLSPLWLKEHRNATVSCALATATWAFWGFQRWVHNPGMGTSVLFGGLMGLLVLAGYPQIVHGAVIYFLVYLLVYMAGAEQRRGWRERFIAKSGTGLLAVLICLGLAAVQLLPLLELVDQSMRKDGVGFSNFGQPPPRFFLRGALYSLPPLETAPRFPLVGSLLVCMIATSACVYRLGSTFAGHVAAATVLLLLGLGMHSPLFKFLYLNQLLPGLSSFRVTYIYMFLFQIGFAVVTAFALDRLSKGEFRSVFHWKSNAGLARLAGPVLLLAWCLGWMWIIQTAHFERSELLHYVFAPAFLLLVLAFLRLELCRFIPLAAVCILLLEIAYFRIDSIKFVDKSVLSPGAIVNYIHQKRPAEDFRIGTPLRARIVRIESQEQAPERLKAYANFNKSALRANTNMLYDLPTIGYVGGLQLSRSDAAEARFSAELAGIPDAVPGLRLIDFFSVRYITGQINRPTSDDFLLLLKDKQSRVALYENLSAQPRFQVFGRAEVVENPQAALERLQGLRERVLIVEAGEKDVAPAAVQLDTKVPLSFTLTNRQQAAYTFQLNARDGGWLFVAEAHYPGWKAHIDGAEVPLYHAQVMGKAVYVPPGSRELRIHFQPRSFIIGSAFTGFTLLSLLVLLLWRLRRRGLAHSSVA